MSSIEQHYTPAQLGKQTGFSPKFIRELFRQEPGVILISRPEEMNKRGYETFRIPASVAELVFDRLRVKEKRGTRLAA
jgi:hypothetical protein